MSSCISRILCLLSFVMINEKQTNAQNAHSSIEWSIGRKSVDSKTRGNKNSMSKITSKHMSTMLAKGFITQESYDQMILEEIGTEVSRGKIDVLRNMAGFEEIEESLQRWFKANEYEVQENMRNNGHPEVAKISVNVAK